MRTEWQREILSNALVLGETVLAGDPWFDVASQVNWYAALWLTNTRGVYHEILSVFSQPKLGRVLPIEQEAADVQRVRDRVSESIDQDGAVLEGIIDVEGCGRPMKLRTIATLTSASPASVR
jgi:hypothetical protein